MSDKIRFDPQTYDQLASKLKSLSSDLRSISDKTTTLAGSSAAKAVLNLTTSGVFNLKGITRSFTYANAAGGLTAARSALRACSEEAEQLARRVTQAKSLFQANERSLVNLVAGGVLSVNGIIDATGNVMDKVTDVVSNTLEAWRGFWSTVSDEIQSWFQESAEEPEICQQSQEQRRQRIEDANKKRVFEDPEGRQYGGNQKGPLIDVGNDKNIQEYINLIEKNTGRILKDKNELWAYTYGLNDEGCGYVAMVNCILQSFEGRAEEFERVFGYPMTDENGNLNYNMLLVDFYSRTDNRTLWFGNQVYNKYEDYHILSDGDISKYDPYTDKGRRGSKISNRDDRLTIFAQEHNLDVQYTDVTGKMTTQNFHEYAKQGTVTIAVEPVILRDANGREICRDTAGHAMTVTGVTESGMYIVSSWGEVAYVDPADYKGLFDRCQFSVSKVTPKAS